MLLAFLLNPALNSLLLLFASIIWMLRDESDRTRLVLMLCLLVNLFYGFLLGSFMSQANSLLPWKYDAYLYSLDSALGVSAPAISGAMTPTELLILQWIYALMVPSMIAAYWIGVPRSQRKNLTISYCAEMLVGPILYAIVPAIGPRDMLGALWHHPPAHVALTLVKGSGMPNAFPSLHLATAFVILASAKHGLWRILAGFFFLGTILSTLSTGEHYVIDLVAGFVFGCFAYNVGIRKFRLALLLLMASAALSLAIRWFPNVLLSQPYALRVSSLAVVATCAIFVLRQWKASTAEGTTPLQPHTDAMYPVAVGSRGLTQAALNYPTNT